MSKSSTAPWVSSTPLASNGTPTASTSTLSSSTTVGSSNIRSLLYPLLNDQLDQIKFKKALKLNNIAVTDFKEVVDFVHEYVNSFNPSLEIVKLSLQSNQITELPSNISLISKSIRFLDLHNNHMSHIRESSMKDFLSLEILDVSSNNLSYLPQSLSLIKGLKVVSLKDNYFKYLPPVLGELNNLNLIEINNNPLILPSLELIKAFQSQRADHDWVIELKNYLNHNKPLLDYKISEQIQKASSLQSLPSQPPPAVPASTLPSAPPPPLPLLPIPLGPAPTSTATAITRSKSISETKSKASKAARRMGLIIKKPNDIDNANLLSTSTSNPTNSESESHDNSTNYSQSATETSFKIGSPPPPTLTMNGLTTSTLTNSLNNSPLSTPVSNKINNVFTDSRPSRPRSNTLKEIDKILEKNDIVDTEHKSGAYFRRLSTLQEIPTDELSGPPSANLNNDHGREPFLSVKHKGNHLAPHQAQYQLGIHTPTSTQANNHVINVPHAHLQPQSTERLAYDTGKSLPSLPPKVTQNEISPSKVLNTSKKYSSNTLVKVSRKILFAFSELHSSVRRFTGFCVDKKVTIRMVSYLYATKSNIDSLVESLEQMEENDNPGSSNSNNIIVSLHSCISSLKSIMNLLSESFTAFVAKIDVCFIRMLYLTLYGSFNELMNAYRILAPNTKAPVFNLPQITSHTSVPAVSVTAVAVPDTKPQKPTNASVSYETSDVDEKLYRAIDISTSNAQVVFGELTKAISKSAIDSAMASSQDGSEESPGSISHAVATKVKELTSVCMTSMDITKRLKSKLLTIRNLPSQATRNLFWDDINLFLKAIIQTFSAVKGIMTDLPILNDIRSSMANLTKTTKDVTVLMEISSYKTMSADTHPNTANNAPSHPPLPTIPSVTNMFAQHHPPLHTATSGFNWMNTTAHSTRTPLTATSTQASLAPINTDNGVATAGPASAFAILGHGKDALSPGVGSNGPLTAPQSTGQFFAKNGMNPFDSLIIANRDRDDGDGNDNSH